MTHRDNIAFCKLSDPVLGASALAKDSCSMHEIFSSGAPFQIFKVIVAANAVFMVYLVSMDVCKGHQNQSVDIDIYISAVLSNAQAFISSRVASLKYFAGSGPHRWGNPHYSSLRRNRVNPFKSEGWLPFFHGAYSTGIAA